MCNTYCVGAHSFPGDVVSRERKLAVEKKNAGKSIAQLDAAELPPCIYSANAFGEEPIKGYSNPPDFFRGGAKRTEWDIAPATICVWPYEAMYSDDVYDEAGKLNNDQRSTNADKFFAQVEKDKSLIFYYTNYSNPFSEEESQRYALIGVSRVKHVGPRQVYEEANDYIRQHYAGGMIWARNISSHYPDAGLRLPYHRYRDDPEALLRFAVFPENPRTCKYAARLLTNDDAIGLLEQFLSAVRELMAIQDDSEDWSERERWLLACTAELWSKRGLYPGLLSVMRFLGAESAITRVRELAEVGKSKEAHKLFFDAVEKNVGTSQLGLSGKALQKLNRQWRLKPPAAQKLLKEVLPRLDLEVDQIERAVSEDGPLRSAHGLPDKIETATANPYVLCEAYVGDSPDDIIPWGRIDRGVLPSPRPTRRDGI